MALVGSGPDRTSLERRAAALHGPVVCSFDGAQGREGVRRRLEWAHALVIASRLETFGVTAVEALAAGRPVISTACGGPERIIEDGFGRLVPPRSPWALAEALVDLAEGRVPFRASEARARMRERFGPEAFLATINRIYSLARSDQVPRPRSRETA